MVHAGRSITLPEMATRKRKQKIEEFCLRMVVQIRGWNYMKMLAFDKTLACGSHGIRNGIN